MEMRDALPGVGADVRHDAIPGLGQSLAPGDLRGDPEDAPEQVPVSLGEVGGRGDMAARDHDDVDRRLRRDVPQRKDILVGMELGRGDLAGRDAAEQAGRVAGVRSFAAGHHSVGFALMSTPIVPTRPAIA